MHSFLWVKPHFLLKFYWPTFEKLRWFFYYYYFYVFKFVSLLFLCLIFQQACLLAAIFETLGAILLGSRVSDTIRKGLFDPLIYTGYEQVLMIGNLCALVCKYTLSLTLFLGFCCQLGASSIPPMKQVRVATRPPKLSRSETIKHREIDHTIEPYEARSTMVNSRAILYSFRSSLVSC